MAKAKVKMEDADLDPLINPSGWSTSLKLSPTAERGIWSAGKPSRPRPTVSYKISLDSEVNALIDTEDASTIVYKTWSTKSPSKNGGLKAKSTSTSPLKSPLVRRHSRSTGKVRSPSQKLDPKSSVVMAFLDRPVGTNDFEKNRYLEPVRSSCKSSPQSQSPPTVKLLESTSSSYESSLSSDLSDVDEADVRLVATQTSITPTKRRQFELPKRLNMTRPGCNKATSSDDDGEGTLLDGDPMEESGRDFQQLVKSFSYQNSQSPLGGTSSLSGSPSSDSAKVASRRSDISVAISSKLSAREPDLPEVNPSKLTTQKHESHVANPSNLGLRKRELSEASSKVASSLSTPASKRSKPNRGYSSPSAYAHLKSIPDHIPLYADVLICGINPGTTSSTKQHHFAHNGNLFWPCMNASGLVKGEDGNKITCEDDHTLPAKFNIGLTNLVHRPTAEAGELSRAELSEHVPKLIEKIRKFQPRIVCLVGKGIWQAIEETGLASGDLVHDEWAEEKVLMASDLYANLTTSPLKNPKKPFEWGLQPYVVHNNKDRAKNGPKSSVFNGGKTYFFVVMSTSGRVAAYRKEDRTIIFTECRRFVAKLRAIHPSTEKHIKDWHKSLMHSQQPTKAEV